MASGPVNHPANRNEAAIAENIVSSKVTVMVVRKMRLSPVRDRASS
jgi:hypothetical protein